MLFVLLGVALLGLKFADIAPVAAWDWWVVLLPFGAAVLWWTFADKSGWTKRHEMEKMEDRKKARRRKHMVALGLNPRERDKMTAEERAVRFQRSKVEQAREEKRRKNRDTIVRASRLDSSASTQFVDSKH
jgi:small Trp-rich protein